MAGMVVVCMCVCVCGWWVGRCGGGEQKLGNECVVGPLSPCGGMAWWWYNNGHGGKKSGQWQCMAGAARNPLMPIGGKLQAVAGRYKASSTQWSSN